MNNEFWQLRTAARNYYDAHRFTTRLSNRIKALARQDPPKAHPLLEAQLKSAQDARTMLGRDLKKIYKQLMSEKCPALLKYQQETVGIGDTYMAQLVGVVGDFKMYTEAWWEEDPTGDEKRVLVMGDEKSVGVREIWAYCGHGDATRKRKRGESQETQFKAGSPYAKTIVHMMAEFALRQNGGEDKNGNPRPCTPYYNTYLDARCNAEDRHPEWTKAHQYNHAVRLVGKAILKDIWRVQHGQDPVYGAVTEWHPKRPVTRAEPEIVATRAEELSKKGSGTKNGKTGGRKRAAVG